MKVGDRVRINKSDESVWHNRSGIITRIDGKIAPYAYVEFDGNIGNKAVYMQYLKRLKPKIPFSAWK
jgi:hypothetical protein